MGETIGGLLYIGFMIFFFVTISKKNAKKRQEAGKDPKIQPAKQAPAKSQAQHKAAPKPKPVPPVREMTPAKPEPYVHHEGETEEEHKRHEQEIREHDERERLAVAEAEDLRAQRRAEMRRAIVMSEILDKPVSMRKGRSAR